MSRSTEHQPQSAVAANAQPELDVEAEHDPEVSRRASLAGLRREAIDLRDEGATPSTSLSINDLAGVPTTSAAPKAGQKVSAAAAQHQKAEGSSRDALEISMKLIARRMYSAADDMHASARTGGTAQASHVQDQFDKVHADLRRLGIELAEAKPTGVYASELHQELRALNRAFGAFDVAATSSMTRFGVNTNPNLVKQELENVHEKLGAKMSEIGNGQSLDGRNENTILDDAIDTNLTAVVESARSVKVGIKTESDASLYGDLGKTIGHLREVVALLDRLDKAALEKHTVRVRAVVHEVSTLEAKLGSKPALVQKAQQSNLAGFVRNLTTKVGK